MSDSLEWRDRGHYALTELVLFLVTFLVLFVFIVGSFVNSYIHLKRDISFFSTLRPLFENVLPSAIAFAPSQQPAKNPHRNKPANASAKTVIPAKVDVIFLGQQERSAAAGGNARRVWVHVYFILLCGLVILWAVSVFSDTVLYRKSSSCTDVSLRDTDLTCFLLSNRDIPPGVQNIIDEEPGELVPCDRVQNYIVTNNISYDLEVICYQYQLNPLAALGISYGAMKSISFTIVSLISVLLAFTSKFYCREINGGTIESNSPKNSKPVSVPVIIASHIILLVCGVVIITIIAIVAAVIHETPGARNSGYDFLRGEMFYRYSVIVLAPITIIYIALFPWWAFEKLDEPDDLQIKDLKNDLRKKLYHFVHSVILHQKFSTGFTALLEILADNALPKDQDVEQPINIENEENVDRVHVKN